MEDEVKGLINTEFVGLQSKMCSLLDLDSEEIKKAEGVNRNVVENRRHKKYVDVYFNKTRIRHKMKRIQSKLYRIGTYDVYEVSLSCFDDRRYTLVMVLIVWLIFIEM